MTDIVERLNEAFHPDDDDGLPTDATVADVREAADEIERLRGELENVERDRMAHAETARLRALITEWAAAMGDKADSFGGLVRYENARVALREEANR